MMVEALRVADRWETIDGRLCDRCSESIPDDFRDDAGHCSVACQQAVWYLSNFPRIKEAARLWAKANPHLIREYRHRRRARMQNNGWEPVDLDKVWARDGGLCWLCLNPIDDTRAFPDPLSMSLDHKYPLSRGGPHTYANVAMAHLGCNMRKGAKIVAGTALNTQ